MNRRREENPLRMASADERKVRQAPEAFDRPHIGMEDKAYGWLTTEGLPYLKKLEGKAFERFETIALTAHGGDLSVESQPGKGARFILSLLAEAK